MALDLNDKTSNGNNLTNVNGVEWTTDFPFAASTEAVDLNGTTAYLWAADSTSLSITGDMTVEAWVQYDSAPPSGAYWCILGKWATSQNTFVLAHRNDPSPSRLAMYLAGPGGSPTYISDAFTPTAGTWYHIAATYTASTGAVVFYVNATSYNGTLESGSDTTSLNDTTARFAIGAFNTENSLSWPFDGKVDEVRVWNDVRTSTEINDNKAVELTGSEANLVAYWPFEALAATGGPVDWPVFSSSKFWGPRQS